MRRSALHSEATSYAQAYFANPQGFISLKKARRSVLFSGLFGHYKCFDHRYNTATIIVFCPHPYRVRSENDGFSHGLKTRPRRVFLTAFRIPHAHQKNSTPVGVELFWRRVWDSNPRSLAGSPVFKTGALNHSDNSP